MNLFTVLPTLPILCDILNQNFVNSKIGKIGNTGYSSNQNHNTKKCHFLPLFFQDLPVLVWIYGGGFMAGSSALEMYNPEEIVKRGNIIFVSMQYRVGSHGFLYFGKDSSAPGNVGLLDQVNS